VGVDIEKLVDYTTDTIDIFCSSKEKELLHLSGDPKNLYYKFWTLKAIGTGLFRDPKDVEVSFINEHQSRIILDKSYWLGRSIVINDEYVLSSVSSSSLEYHQYINISADTFYYESAENVPLVQKSLIKKCNALGMPVITATQMLDSMQENPRPTRAEASDVANAVFDGTDATMLSGESANGLYPVESVAMMAKIDEKAENTLAENGTLQLNRFDKTSVTETIGIAIARAAKNLGIKTIVAATESGYTAKMISKYRPNADILAITFDERTQRGLMVNWGVQPIVAEKPETTDDMFDLAASKAVELGFAKEGDLILITAGVPVGERGTTNIMKIQLIGSKLADGQGVGDETVIGKAVIATSAQEASDKAVEGGVLVTKTTDKDYLPAIEKSSALVVENGGLTSHAAVVGISMGIPVIVGVKDATSVIADGQLITVDSRRGIVYRGASNAL